VNEYGQFHDGSFDGLWINEKTAHIFLTADENQSFVAVLSGVVALNASEFRAGSIILSVDTRESEEIGRDDIAELYDLHEGAANEAHVFRQLAKARDEKLMLLVIAPSYDAYCLVLAGSMELLPRADWIRRYCPGEIT